MATEIVRPPKASGVSQSAAQVKTERRNYYVPRQVMRDAAGLARVERGFCDCYTGTGEALEAAGILTVDMLPGQPGRPATKVRYWPVDGQARGKRSILMPGALEIFRKPAGTFRVDLVVSELEQRRRAASDKPDPVTAFPSPAPIFALALQDATLATRFACLSAAHRGVVERAMRKALDEVEVIARAADEAFVDALFARAPAVEKRRAVPQYLQLVWAAPPHPSHHQASQSTAGEATT